VNDGLQSEIGGRRNSHLADAVRAGRYSPDERLPALVSLAVANQANEVRPRTMSRALRRLRKLGYVTYRQGYGYFVSHTPPGYE
jgi:DNA-binding transcriptional regulator YhcF (GntR family)